MPGFLTLPVDLNHILVPVLEVVPVPDLHGPQAIHQGTILKNFGELIVYSYPCCTDGVIPMSDPDLIPGHGLVPVLHVAHDIEGVVHVPHLYLL